jgi:hypothetical protein
MLQLRGCDIDSMPENIAAAETTYHVFGEQVLVAVPAQPEWMYGLG